MLTYMYQEPLSKCQNGYHIKNNFTGRGKIPTRDENDRFSNARKSIRYYQIFTGHFKNPSDIMFGNPVNSQEIYEKLLRITCKPKDVATY